MNISQKKLDILVLGVFSVIILFWNLGGGSLTSWDEAFYAQVSKEILQTGDWVNLHLMGKGWSDKPPLYMWFTAASFKAFGINEFSVRLFSAMCGIGTVLLVYLLAFKLYSRKAAVASSVILLSTWHFLWASRIGMLDGTLTFFITLAITSFRLGETNRKLLFLSPLAFALAFMTKGAGAMLIPMILGLYIIFSKKFKLLAEPSLWMGILLGSFLVTWWHWQAFTTYGDEFVQNYFRKHLLSRTTQSLDGHTGNIFTYFSVIPNKGRPWGFLGLIGAGYILLRLLVKRESRHLLPVIWAGIVLALFSLVRTKLHWYIMPLYPALSIAAGYTLSSLLKRYTVPLVSCLCIASIIYLGTDKAVFDPDYSPRIKQTARDISALLPSGETLYLHDVGDPAMQFYLGNKFKYIHEKDEIKEIASRPGMYILTTKNSLPLFERKDQSVLLEEDVFVLLKGDRPPLDP